HGIEATTGGVALACDQMAGFDAGACVSITIIEPHDTIVRRQREAAVHLDRVGSVLENNAGTRARSYQLKRAAGAIVGAVQYAILAKILQRDIGAVSDSL